MKECDFKYTINDISPLGVMCTTICDKWATNKCNECKKSYCSKCGVFFIDNLCDSCWIQKNAVNLLSQCCLNCKNYFTHQKEGQQLCDKCLGGWCQTYMGVLNQRCSNCKDYFTSSQEQQQLCAWCHTNTGECTRCHDIVPLTDGVCQKCDKYFNMGHGSTYIENPGSYKHCTQCNGMMSIFDTQEICDDCFHINYEHTHPPPALLN